jgi:hypothetical protein
VAPKSLWCDPARKGNRLVRSGGVTQHRLLSCDVQAGRLRASVEAYPGWVLEVRCIRIGSAPPVVAELRVHPSAPAIVPDGGLATRLMRHINVGELVELFRTYAAEEADQYAEWAEEIPRDRAVLMDLAATTRLMSLERARPGRKGHGIDHYLTWAVRYAEKVRDHVRNPHAELAHENPGMTAIAVRDTIKDARVRYGLLTKPPGRGRAGGDLTDKALTLLAAGRGPNSETKAPEALAPAEPISRSKAWVEGLTSQIRITEFDAERDPCRSHEEASNMEDSS